VGSAIPVSGSLREQRVLSMRVRGDASLPRDLAPLYLDYQPGDYERAFTLSGAVDPAGIEATVRSGVLYLRLPKSGPAKCQRIEARPD
jgi:HSP20 family protein